MTIEQIIQSINNFIPFQEDDPYNTNEIYFYDLMDQLKSKIEFSQAIEPLFRLLEKYPHADFGSPGPIVHTMESFPGQYEELLNDSLNRKPTPLTIWMFNRIINGEQNSIIKANLIEQLMSFSSHPYADIKTLEIIREFVDFQKN